MPLLPKLRSLFRRKAYSVPMVPAGSGGWYPLVREPFTTAWQRNMEISAARSATFHADFSCKTLIARDIAKLPLRLVERDAGGIWKETSNAAYSPVLRKPNHFQTRNQFWESWILSKLSRGNAYVLKVRDSRRVVTALYVINPDHVQVLEADDGSVFYRLSTDRLSGVERDLTVPASEMIHDRMNTLFHHLVGIPPIWASALAATQGLNIQTQSVRLFANNARPSGILTAPGPMSKETAERLTEFWQQNYGGENLGKVAAFGDGLKYEPMVMTAEASQAVEQLKLTAEVVCSTYHVPSFMIGAGPEPATGSAQERTLRYYTQCLQSLIEDAESCLDEGLGLLERSDLGIDFDTDNLLRMDTASQANVEAALVKGGVKTPNEARAKFNLPRLAGGDTVYLQQQDIPMSVAASVKEHPLNVEAEASRKPPPAPSEPPVDDDDEEPPLDEEAREFAAWRLQKALEAQVA